MFYMWLFYIQLQNSKTWKFKTGQSCFMFHVTSYVYLQLKFIPSSHRWCKLEKRFKKYQKKSRYILEIHSRHTDVHNNFLKKLNFTLWVCIKSKYTFQCLHSLFLPVFIIDLLFRIFLFFPSFRKSFLYSN